MKKFRIEPVLVRHDSTRPDLVPFEHQRNIIARYEDEDVIPLFMDMGTGKSFTTLQIAQAKFRAGKIKALLVVAPNDVHRQWFDELVFGVDKDNDGIMWQELQVDFEAQCVGGRGGQKELYPFQTDGLFKFVSVNVDTFSQPTKWQPIVEWANGIDCMIAIDEATCIKHRDSQRGKRLLYSFNNTKWYKNNVIFNQKRSNSLARAVLTGTPATNGPVDLWAIMEFVSPNYFRRNYYAFQSYFGMYTQLKVETPNGDRKIDTLLNERTWKIIHDCDSYYAAACATGCSQETYMVIKHQDCFKGPYKHADELKSLLSRTATFLRLDNVVDMPETQYMTRRTGMSDAQQKAYDSMKKQLMAEYAGKMTTAKTRLVVSMRLQQISSGFIVGKAMEGIDDDEAYDLMPDEVVWLGDKIPKLEALMRDVEECDKPLLIVTRYSAEAAKIYELCEKAGYRTGLYTGWKVIGGTDAFKAGEIDVLVANSTKICRGHNLQISHVILFYSNSFDLEVRLQTERRTRRMGQQHVCVCGDYACAPVDDTVIRALRLKKGLLDFIMDKDMKEAV